jgi:hypothetical protein
MEVSMTVVKPRPDHPWNKSISIDVERRKLMDRIKELNERVKMLRIEIKMNETKLKELTTNGKQ